MNFKSFIFILVIGLMLSITAVSAEDMEDTDDTGKSVGTFEDFQNIVNNAPENSIIKVDKDYEFGASDDKLNDKEGIIINKNIKIYGNGHTFDAKSSSGIFQSSKGNIELRELNFKNGYQKSADDGGAIRILGDASYYICGCSFDSNHALQDCGAIYNEGGNLTVMGSVFINNRAEGANKLNDCDGGAIHSKAPTYVYSSYFGNNYAADSGGAIYTSKGLYIEKTKFENNVASKKDGGAVYTNEFLYYITNCSFIGNSAKKDGGAVYVNWKDVVSFEYCLFAYNVCGDEGGAIYMDCIGSDFDLVHNAFIHNSASENGGTVFSCGSSAYVKNNYWEGPYDIIGWTILPFLSNNHWTDREPLSSSPVEIPSNCNVATAVSSLISRLFISVLYATES